MNVALYFTKSSPNLECSALFSLDTLLFIFYKQYNDKYFVHKECIVNLKSILTMEFLQVNIWKVLHWFLTISIQHTLQRLWYLDKSEWHCTYSALSLLLWLSSLSFGAGETLRDFCSGSLAAGFSVSSSCLVSCSSLWPSFSFSWFLSGLILLKWIKLSHSKELSKLLLKQGQFF